ncbi:MAG: WS/DGAT/MGAT family O-acyltransferase [Pseudomonadales bacterium]
MYRLHGNDASFLYQETPTAPMHTIKVYIMTMPEGSTIDWEGIKRDTESVLHTMPMLRQRPVFVPFGLHHPVMIEAPDFDLEYHMCRAALPAPGGMRELEEMVAQIASQPLDVRHPLWEMWLIEGLADGRFASVHKIHHALADGMATVGYMNKVWSSETFDDRAKPPDWIPEAIPSRRRLIWHALVDHAKQDVRNLPSFIKTLSHSFRGLHAHSKLHPSPIMKGMSGDLPRCHWNYALSPKRNFATTQLNLHDVRQLKNRIGGTINDVVLGLATASLRNFLQKHREQCDKPLIASIPVAADEGDAKRDHGNRISTFSTLLHVGIEDPLERYRAVIESTKLGKAELDIMGKNTYGLLMHYTPPALLQWISQRKYRRRQANNADYLPPANLSISNVPGPKEVLRARDNAVTDLYSIGPLVDGIGLNITVWSYAGKLNFSVMGCKKALPNIFEITDGIEPALRELQQAADSIEADHG